MLKVSRYPLRVVAFWCGVVVCLFLVLYVRTVTWGWLMFDDKALILDNPHLGQWTWENWKWAFTDTAFGRRWTPLLWAVALVPPKTAVAFHMLVVCLGAVLCGLVFVLLLRFADLWEALALACLFVACPLRLEVFAWNMGFVYETVAIFSVAAFLTDVPLLALAFAWCALLTYPQAAGVFLIVLWRMRSSPWAWVSVWFFLMFTLFQYQLRHAVGFIPWHVTFAPVPLALLHYVLMLVFPVVTSPVFPATWYPALAVGAFVLSVWLAADWRSCAVCLLVLSPVFAAAVTESFWLGARYSLLFDIAVLCVVGGWLRGYWSRWLRPSLWLCVGLGAFLVGHDRVFAGDEIHALSETVKEADSLGADCLFYRVLLHYMSARDWDRVSRYPELAKELKGIHVISYLPPVGVLPGRARSELFAVGRVALLGRLDLREFERK